MKKELDRAEAKGAPDISGLLAYRVRQLGGPPRQGGIKWPEASIYRAAIDGFEGVPLGTHFAVWLNRAAVEKKLTAMIREKLGDKEGVSAEDRAAEESALRSDAIRLMRIEAALCDEAEALGETVERRRLHPEAWLGIAPGKPALASSRQTGGMAMPAGSPVTVGVKVTAPTAKAAAAAKK
jgi:hypothetical protein